MLIMSKKFAKSNVCPDRLGQCRVMALDFEKWAKYGFASNYFFSINLMHFLPCTMVKQE